MSSWTLEEDLALAETVLRYIREGSTEEKVFKEISQKFNRSESACAFRWNYEVKKKYEKAVEIAKKQSLLRRTIENKDSINQPIIQRNLIEEVSDTTHDTDNKETIFNVTIDTNEKSQLEETYNAPNMNDIHMALHILSEFINEKTDREEYIEKILDERKDLQTQLKSLKEELKSVKEEYHEVIKFMNRMRVIMESDNKGLDLLQRKAKNM